jgi:hypothetical protein
MEWNFSRKSFTMLSISELKSICPVFLLLRVRGLDLNFYLRLVSFYLSWAECLRRLSFRDEVDLKIFGLQRMGT